MRHRKAFKKLGRTSAHKSMLLSNLVCSLIEEKRITTTLPKAKLARQRADRMVTLGKNGSLAARRRAVAILHNKRAVKVLFDEIAPSFKERNGGYVRIIKCGRRRGDSAEMAILEWVSSQMPVSDDNKSEQTDSKE